MDKEGKSKGPSGRAIYTKKMMTADECARITLEAARRRKRKVVMGPGRLTLWLKLIAPNWLDKLTITTFLRPMVHRLQKAGQQAENE
jgi:short-subunit dehydrogenase